MLDRVCLYLAYLLTLLVVIIYKDAILFWDTVQFAGRHGLFFFENGFSLTLPEALDSGHPPTFGWYQCILWQLGGCSLQVSHFSMLPFLFTNIYLIHRLSAVLLDAHRGLLLFALLLCPFYLGQTILVSPDLVLISGFLMCLYGIITDKRGLLIGGSIILALISMRGAVVLSCLMLYHLTLLSQKATTLKPVVISMIKIYSYAIVLLVVYQVYHLLQTSWLGFHDESPWQSSFQIVSISDWVRHCGIYLWRIMDHGMIVPFLIVVTHAKKLLRLKPKLIWLWVILIVVFLFLLTPFSGLLNHRYILPIQLLTIILAFQVLGPTKMYLPLLLVITMGLGNLLIYPDHIAKGWDASAAHWPFYNLYQEVGDFIDGHPALSRSEVGTAFPVRTFRAEIELGEESESIGYHKFDLSKDKYILYSNVMNEFSDHDLAHLEQWEILYDKRYRGVKVILYKKPK